MTYLARINAALQEIALEEGLSNAEYQEHFRIYIESNIKNRILALHKIIIKADTFFQKIPEPNKVVADQDIFSKEFEADVADLFNLWIKQDEALRDRYKAICLKFNKVLSILEMENIIEKAQRKLHQDIVDHVKEANQYGESWTSRMDKANLTVKPETRNFVKGLATITIETINSDYQRELKKLIDHPLKG